MAAVEHAQARIVDLQGMSTERPRVDRLGDRLEQLGPFADPAAQGGGGEFDPGPPEDRHLAIEGQVVPVLGDQHVTEKPCAGPATVDHTIGQGRDHHALATARAGVLLAHVHEHAERRRDPVEHLRALGPDARACLATVRADELSRGRTMHDLFTRQMGRQRFASGRLRALAIALSVGPAFESDRGDEVLCCAVGLGLTSEPLEEEDELARVDLFRAPSVGLTQHLGQAQLEAVGVLVHAGEELAGDLDRLVGLPLGDEGREDVAQGRWRREWGGGGGHAILVSNGTRLSSYLRTTTFPPPLCQRWPRRMLRRSMPSSTQARSPASISTPRAPSRTSGHRNVPRSNRFANRHHPERSR